MRHVREHEGSSRPKAFCVGEFWKGLSEYWKPWCKTYQIDSVDTLVEYIEGLGTQFSCFDSCLQGGLAAVALCPQLTISQL